MTVYATSDLHLDHKNILVYEAKNRPFKDTDEMNGRLIKNWNDVVKSDDTVWCLGDFKMRLLVSSPKPFVDRLSGHKKLVIGNHDRILDRHRNMDWEKTKAFWLAAGFEEVYQDYLLDFNGKLLYLKHEPVSYQFWKGASLQLCGHVHSQWSEMPAGPIPGGKIINVGVDVRGLKPVSIEELIK
jgi:calcineurin-like phosphoesterase family protein